MRDDIQGGVLATLIAAPLVVVCCGTGLAQPTARAVGMLRAGRF